MTATSSDIEAISEALVLLQDLQYATKYEDWVLLVPPDVLAGQALVAGIGVWHIPGLDCVYVAKRTEIGGART